MGIKENVQEAVQKIGKRNLAIIGVGVIVLLAVLFFILPGMKLAAAGEVKAIFTVKDEQGQPLQNIELQYRTDEGNWRSVQSDFQGKAVLSVPVESTLFVRIDEISLSGKEFYAVEYDYIVSEYGLNEEIYLSEKEFLPETKTILLQGFDGEIAPGSVTANFLCGASGETWSELNAGQAGNISTSVSGRINCGELIATIISDAFEEMQVSFAENESMLTASLRRREVPPGQVNVILEDEEGTALSGYFLVALQKDFTEADERNSNGYSDVVFRVAPGRYTATVEDTRGEYGLGNSEEFLVESDGHTSVTVQVSKTPKGTITVRVIDEDNLHELVGAEVVLKDASGHIYAREETGEGGSAEFVVSDLQEYSVSAVMEGGIGEGYFSAEEIVISEAEVLENPEITVELEKKTSTNTGRVKVNVIDEDALPVKNAKVQFMVAGGEEDGSADYLLLGEEGDTDVNGEAEFILGQIDKPIYPYVTKYPAISNDRLGAKPIVLEDETEFDVTMVIGDATIEVEIVSKETGRALDNASYEVFRITGEPMIPGTRPVFEGKDSLTLKADAKVYFRVTAPGHTTFYSQALQLWPDQTFTVKADLSPAHVIALPSIEFEGVFNELGTEAMEIMSAGENYRVRMRMQIPGRDKIGEYAEYAGIHFRTGESFTVENDALYIYGTAGEGIFAPANPSIVKGKTYREGSGGVSGEQLTEGRAKWVNLVWGKDDIDEDGAEYLVDVIVSPTRADAKLAMYYRVELETHSGQVLRDPYDSGLSNASTSEDLYAKAYAIEDLFEGETIGCGEAGREFCWSSEKLVGHIPNIGDDLEFTDAESYSVSNFSEYDYEFTLLNGGKRVYEEETLVLNVGGDAIEILNYEFENADGAVETPVDGVIEDPQRLEFGDLGEFTFNKQVKLKLRFRTIEKVPERIEVTLVADQSIKFEKTKSFRIVADNELVIAVEEPEGEVIPAFSSDTVVTLKVTDSDTGYLLNDVELRAELRDPERPDPLWTDTVVTGEGALGDGIAQFIAPPAEPGSKIVVNAFKLDYAENSIELLIDDEILAWDPAVIEYELDVKTERQVDEEVTLRNRTGVEWKVTDVQLFGWYMGIMNTDAMGNFLVDAGNSLPLSIAAMGEIDLFTRAKLEDDAGSIMTAEELGSIVFDEEEHGAKIILTLENRLEGQTVNVEIPLNIAVSFGEAPEGGCLELTDSSNREGFNWIRGLEAGEATLSFSIVNNCYLDGQPVSLGGLQVELKPDGEMAGNIDFIVDDPDLFGATTEFDTLIPNHKTNYDFTVRHRDEDTMYTTRVVFKPKPYWEGKISKFDIIIKGLSGAAGTDGPTVVTVDATTHIHGEIANINLKECISLNEDEVIKLENDEEEKVITFKNSCALTAVDLELCRDNPLCAGGIEGVTSGLELSKETVELARPEEGGETEETVTVNIKGSKVLGLYGVTVDAQTEWSQGNPQPLGEVEVQVKEDGSDWVELNDYEFHSTANSGHVEEESELTNRIYLQKLEIEMNECDWENYNSDYVEYTSGWGGEAAVYAYAGGAATAGTVAVILVTSAVVTGPVGWIAAVVIGVAAAIIIYIVLACDDSEFVPYDGFMDFQMKLGHQDSLAKHDGEWTETESDLEDCKLEFGDEEHEDEWNGECRQCFAGDISVIREAYENGDMSEDAYDSARFNQCEGPRSPTFDEIMGNNNEPETSNVEGIGGEDSGEAHVEMNLAWFGQSHTEVPRLGEDGLVSSLPVELIKIDVSKIEGPYVSPRPMYGLLTVKGHYDMPFDTEDPLRCECDEDGEDCPYSYHIGTSDEKGECSNWNDEGGRDFEFHLKFNPVLGAEVLHVPEFQECHGVKEGKTGESVLPRVRFNWDWTGSGEEDQIRWNACDANNENYIYCDATQFGIMVSKRLKILREFFIENDHQFICPQNWQDAAYEDALAAENEENAMQEIARGSIGLSSLITEIEESTGRVRAVLQVSNNQIDGNVNRLTVKLVMRDPEGVREEKEVTVRISSGSDPDSVEEFFDLGEEGIYTVVAIITEPVSLLDRDTALYSSAYYSTYDETAVAERTAECFLPLSTVSIDDIVALEYFINPRVPGVGQYVNDVYEDGVGIDWPDSWADVDDEGNRLIPEWPAEGTPAEKMDFLRDLVSFDAYLIKDNYSEDFQGDFAHYYTQVNFADTWPSFIDGFADYFNDTGKMKFLRKGIRDERRARELLTPGKYYVNIAATFENENGWKFFNAEEAVGKIDVLFKHIQAADPEFIFYHLPFDGEVGKETENGRVNYGIDYSNDLDESIYLTGVMADKFVKLERISNSSVPLINMSLEKRADLQRLNSRVSTRGNLLEVKMSRAGEAKMIFSPNNFAPAVLQMERNLLSDDPFTAEYSLSTANGAVDTGSNLTYWYGLGKCLDFTGAPLKDSFNMNPDRKSSLDESNYAIEWPYASKVGNVFLATVFYLPPNQEYIFSARHPVGSADSSENVYFINNEFGTDTQLELEVEEEDTLRYVADVFEAVKQERVCINLGPRGEMHFWWNPKEVFERAGIDSVLLDVNAVEQRVISDTDNRDGSFRCIESG